MPNDRPDPAPPGAPAAPACGRAGPPTDDRRGGARPRLEKGSLRVFRLFGVDVFLHWSWFFAVLLEFWWRPRLETAPHYHAGRAAWYVAEVLALVALVLLHEFGHALACRSVGGRAERIY